MQEVANNGHSQFVSLKEDEYYSKKVGFINHTLVETDSRARMVLALLERWGPVQAEPDGYDTKGRQQMRLLTPDETVVRAIQIVEAAYHRFEAKGWSFKVPDYLELAELSKNIKTRKTKGMSTVTS
jgi:hypothetical protein